jgi:catechol 2,3-dioxygenase-like lactoylglutathione lyase family enzyme
VRDYDEARDWFVRALSFEVSQDADLGNGKRWVVMRPRGARGAALLLAKAVSEQQQAAIGNQFGGRVGFFLETSDFDADCAHMKAQGVTFAEAPRTEPYGKVAVFEDLYGNRWDLIEPKR